MTDKEVTRALASIDKATTDQARTTGPFSVFLVQSEHSQSGLQEGALFLGEAEKPPNVPEREYGRNHTAQDIESSIPPRHNGNESSIPSSMEVRLPPNTFSYNLGFPQIRDPSVTMLMHHYTNNIVHLMQPVSHRENPFQTLYLPLAIEGSSFTETSQGSQGISPATVAVFHSLICSAATNLQGLGSRDSKLQQLACWHKERALNALRNSLVRKVGRYKDLMVAILSLVSVDVGL